MVIAKPGLDGHDRGAKIIARALRDAGMEVIYTGLHQTPEQIVETAIQEDADAVGVSILSGAHMTLVPRIVDGLKENGADDVLVVVGGHDPTGRCGRAQGAGVAAVFGPGATTGRDRRLPARRRRGVTPVLAVNGRVVASTRRFLMRGRQRFSGLVPETSFRDGFNRIELLSSDTTSSGGVRSTLIGRNAPE